MAYQPIPNPMPVTTPDLTGSGTITALDTVVAAPAGDGAPLTGTSTANSYVSWDLGSSGDSAWALLVTGTWTGTLYFEVSLNSTNGIDGHWIPTLSRQSGQASDKGVNNTTTNGVFRGNMSGFKHFRVRSKGASHTGTASVTINVSAGTGAMFLMSSIPAGGEWIGTVGTIPGVSSTSTDRSGSVTTGGTAQILAAANTTRQGLTIQNTSTGDLRITENGTTATATTGYKLLPNASASVSTRNSISVFGATTGQTWAATEY